MSDASRIDFDAYVIIKIMFIFKNEFEYDRFTSAEKPSILASLPTKIDLGFVFFNLIFYPL